MEVWFRWCSFSNTWCSSSMVVFGSVSPIKSDDFPPRHVPFWVVNDPWTTEPSSADFLHWWSSSSRPGDKKISAIGPWGQRWTLCVWTFLLVMLHVVLDTWLMEKIRHNQLTLRISLIFHRVSLIYQAVHAGFLNHQPPSTTYRTHITRFCTSFGWIFRTIGVVNPLFLAKGSCHG